MCEEKFGLFEGQTPFFANVREKFAAVDEVHDEVDVFGGFEDFVEFHESVVVQRVEDFFFVDHVVDLAEFYHFLLVQDFYCDWSGRELGTVR